MEPLRRRDAGRLCQASPGESVGGVGAREEMCPDVSQRERLELCLSSKQYGIPWSTIHGDNIIVGIN